MEKSKNDKKLNENDQEEEEKEEGNNEKKEKKDKINKSFKPKFSLREAAPSNFLVEID